MNVKDILFRKPRDKSERIEYIIQIVMVLFTAVYTIKYNEKMYHVDSMGFGIAGVIYAMRYIPLMLTTALGGAVTGMMSVVLIFLHTTFAYSSFAYLSFIYLVVACVVDGLVRRKWFDRFYKIIPVTVLLMSLTGALWGIILLLLSDYGIYTLTWRQIVLFFLNELPGCFLGALLIYLLLNRLPSNILLLFGNGKYYVDKKILSDDEKYEVEERSRIGKVVMNIIVLEALVLGIFAELASNALIPTMRYDHESAKASVLAQKSQYGHVGSADRMESLVSLEILEESQRESSYITGLLSGNEENIINIKYSVRMAMLISIIVIPMAIFMNRYAQRRIVAPIRQMSKSMSAIYNSNDININENINVVHNLDISTGDEIEELYHAMDLMVYRLVEYIQLVRTRQSIEDQLEIAKSANEAKSRFLSNISHEIRTPINAVLGFDEMILRESNDENVLSYAKDIQNSGKTLLALISDVLDFSKIEAGKINLIPVEYEIGSLLNDLVNMAEVRAKEKNLDFNINVNEKIPHVLFGDEIRIKQCIINIITNGIKYTQEGSVTMSVDYEVIEPEDPETEDDDMILLKVKVSDTGIGIKEEDIGRLSSAFERVDELRNRTIEGTGLGISIVTSLLDLMGSKLNVKSEYGVGSEFSFAINQPVVDWEPLGDFDKKVKEVRIEGDTYKEAFHAPDARILVVDDTKTNLTVIQGLLKFTRMQVDTATSGMEAIEKARETRYNMIFLDHRMPEMDGIQTFHALKELDVDTNKDTPVIALTANAISGSREMYFKEGFTNYMSKPVDPLKLEEMILMYLPPELVSRPGDEGFTPTDDKDSEKEAMQDLLKLSGVDINAAIERCGSAALARDVMRDFWQSIDDRADKIENYGETENIKDYTIYVHGLKSSARAIGALDLGDMAEHLEACGNNGEAGEIRELTPGLLELYRSYRTKLLPIIEPGNEADKPKISGEELEGAFASIKEFVSASYFDSADDIMSMLEGYSIPDEYRDKYKEVKRLLSSVDRDGLLNIL